jgi:hypothetical protein
LTADYSTGIGPNNGMETTFPFSGSPINGALDHHPFVSVYGSFDILAAGGTGPYSRNDFEFQLDLNTGRLFDGFVDVIYDIPGNEVDIFLHGGTGLLIGNSFSLSLSGTVDDLSLPPSSATGVLAGTFDSSTPDVGSHVVPGSGSLLTISTAHSFIPPSLNIAAGSVHQAGH